MENKSLVEPIIKTVVHAKWPELDIDHSSALMCELQVAVSAEGGCYTFGGLVHGLQANAAKFAVRYKLQTSTFSGFLFDYMGGDLSNFLMKQPYRIFNYAKECIPPEFKGMSVFFYNPPFEIQPPSMHEVMYATQLLTNSIHDRMGASQE